MPSPEPRRPSPGDVPSKSFAAALVKETERLGRITDPVDRARAISSFMDALAAQLEPLAHVRVEAVAEMRRTGMSYADIAETGITKERAGQLARLGGEGGRQGRVGRPPRTPPSPGSR